MGLDMVRGAGGSESPTPNYIRASWIRCEEEYGLSADRISKPDVLTQRELRETSDRLDDLIFEAKSELQNMFLRLKNHDYLVTLTNSEGITLENFIPPGLEDDARAFSLYNGSIWGEAAQGTNGVGTAISTGAAVSVVAKEHFSTNLTGLACTAAPILDSQRRIAAVLNVTTPRETTRPEQEITLQLVKQAAKRIENVWFTKRFKKYSVLQIASVSSFSDIANSELLALDDSGRLIATTLPDESPLSPKNHTKIACKNYLEKVLRMTPENLFDAITNSKPLVFGDKDAKNLYVRSHNIGGLTPQTQNNVKASRRRPVTAKKADLAEPTLSDLIAKNSKLQRSVNIAERAFEGGLSILLTGETGTGKGAFAKALHSESSRANKPFVPINCAAIPEELFESILFGYLPGAFTGAAKEGSQGSVLDANGGTLFLDEVGDMPLNSQVRLLRVLSEKEVTPLGSSVPISVDINVVSATLHDLKEKMSEKKFRGDLYYRIASVGIEIPALRNREDKDDVIERLCTDMFKAHGKSGQMSTVARKALKSYDWRGNIRELVSVLKYAAVLDTDDIVDLDDLPDQFHQFGLA
ncbi:sigma-54-dependent Fis family transcriptional regulator [Pacificoceanicola onchidii]|uniref:sigma-54-dependent Fis family transcriptional regulator n=1 Tax=Pacificoceanicola onchidii TaxID=2562685 RepID=UPI0010A584E5|nr:sigma-54-dependent Fis family transcriptional regulator [Pacificoceanicola onchidii]